MVALFINPRITTHEPLSSVCSAPGVETVAFATGLPDLMAGRILEASKNRGGGGGGGVWGWGLGQRWGVGGWGGGGGVEGLGFRV